jgi:hypothetical protein
MITVKWRALAFMLVFSSAAYAQQPGPDAQGQWRGGQRMQEVFGRLGLSQEQKKLLEANKRKYRARMEAARRQIKAARQGLKLELMKPELNVPGIMAIHERIKSIQSQMEDDKLNSILAVRQILNQEQFLKLLEVMRKHREKEERDSQ